MKLSKVMMLFAIASSLGVLQQSLAETKKVDPVDIGVEYRYWSADMSHSARFSRYGVGSEFDFKKDLGMDDDEISELGVSVRSGKRSEFRFNHIAKDYKGRMLVSRSIDFKGTTFTPGTNVNSSLKIDYSKLQYRWYTETSPEPWRFGVIMDLKTVYFDLALTPAQGTFGLEEEKELFWMPGSGAIAEWQVLPNGIVYAEGSGMALDLLGMKPSGYMYDFEYGFRYLVCDGFDLTAGYRMLEFKSSDSPDNFELGLDGFFGACRIKF